VGVLITGESGVGKSESALELIKRGHQLVADDVVDICRVNDNRLVGESPEAIRHFMEIRGVGIIDIRAMYGISAVLMSKSIDMEIHLEPWIEKKEYDRLGLDEDFSTIMDVKIPKLVIPVKPGRNLAIIIEIAARNHSLKRLGYSAAQELDKRLTDMAQQGMEDA
jgi:HPr kinase/phosphorylase